MKHHEFKAKKSPSTIKIPLQSKTKTGKTIFVYIRRSTTNKQELSIMRQEDNAKETILQAGYNPDEVEYYIESVTAYNGVSVMNGEITRKRVEFTKMLHDIDKSPVPVTILTYEHSRLSRNTIDSGEILKRIFHKYDNTGGTISEIIFNGGEKWDNTNRYSDIEGHLAKALAEGETISIRSTKASLRQQRKGRYILATPIGIDRLKEGEDELRTNEKMEFIKRAWEMRANGKSKREIQRYLGLHSITISTSFEKFFQKLIYTGNWEDPETGELIPQNFVGGKAPISWDLWERVQGTLIKNTGKRIQSKYGKKQEGDTISHLMKWEEDKSKSFSVEFAKGKYKSYKSNAHGGYNKSERKILEKFIEHISPVMEESYKKIVEVVIKTEREKLRNGNEDLLLLWENSPINKELQKRGIVRTVEEFIEDLRNDEMIDELRKAREEDYYKMSLELFIEYFARIARENSRLDDNIEEREKLIKTIRIQIGKKEQDKEQVEVNALINGFSREIADKAIISIQNEIEALQSSINTLSQSSDIAQYLGRLPEVMGKILELSSKVLSIEEIEGMRGDILQLIQLTTLELSISTKKELKVKLFDGLENFLKDECSIWLPE